MAKIDLNTVSSGYLSQAALNANFTAIEDELQNKVLYRDNPSGEPNSMQTHLDMNGYHVLNAGNPSLMDADNIAYTADATGAETRTIAEKLSEVVSVKDFGAVGDGVTDDTAAIQAAVAHVSLNAFGGIVFLPQGDYKCTSTIVVNADNVLLKGAGSNSTRVLRSTNYGPTFRFAKSSGYLYGVGLSSMWLIDTNQSMTIANSPKHIVFDGANRARIDNINVSEGTGVFDLAGCINVFVSDLFYFSSSGSPSGRSALWVGPTSNANIATKHGANIFINNVDLECGSTSGAGNARCDYGILVECVDGLWLNNAHVQNTEVADLRLYRTVPANTLGNIYASNTMLDICQGHGLLIDGTQQVQRVVFSGSISCASAGASNKHGVYITGTGGVRSFDLEAVIDGWLGNGILIDAYNAATVVADVSIKPRNIITNGVTGIYLARGERISVTGGVVGVGSNIGVRVGNASKVSITGVTATDNTTYGVQFDSGATNLTCVSNNFTANGSGAINDLSGNITKVISGNSGQSLTWTLVYPTIAATSGTITSVSTELRYRKEQTTLFFTLTIYISTNGTGAGAVTATMPFAALSASTFSGMETGSTRASLTATLPASSSTLTIYKYDGTYPGGNTYNLVLTGSYEVA